MESFEEHAGMITERRNVLAFEKECIPCATAGRCLRPSLSSVQP